MIDATKPGTVTVTKVNRPGWVLVRLSLGCATGANVQLVPSSGIGLRDFVPSTTGVQQLSDVVAYPLGRDVELVATRPNGRKTIVKFHLTNLPSCTGGTPC